MACRTSELRGTPSTRTDVPRRREVPWSRTCFDRKSRVERGKKTRISRGKVLNVGSNDNFNNDDEVFECESKHEQLLASPSSSESSSASKPRPGPLLLRVSCPGPWEWLRVEQQPLNYADSSHNRGWEKVCERQSRRFFDALASRKPPSDSKPVFLFFPSFSLSLCTYSSFPAARSSTTRAFLKLVAANWLAAIPRMEEDRDCRGG